MLQSFKKLFLVGLLAFGWQMSWGFSLLGPAANGTPVNGSIADTWQVETIGYNPIANYNGAPPYLGADSLSIAPKNISEGYRRNLPVVYYGFDSNFRGFFGTSGEQAVVQAFDILNALTNVDSYSSNLVEFPLQSQSQNYLATTLGLRDLKSTTLSLMMEQMGLADAIRYTWVIKNRYVVPPTPCPGDVIYLVTLRNFDIMASPLSQLQYSPYINGELYTYYIPVDLCGVPPAEPSVDAIEVPADPLTKTAPVASGGAVAEGALQNGFFYTGLTRDDVGGLRSLYSSNTVNFESVVSSSVPVSSGGGLTMTNFNDEFTLTTSNLTQLILDSKTNNPTALQALYPNLIITSVVTNLFSGTYIYTFGNLITNFFPFYTNFPVQIQVQDIGPVVGAPYGTISTNTTATTVMSNILSGAFLLAPTNTCGVDIVQVLATNITTVTNFLGSGTNISGSAISGFLTNIFSTNLVFNTTNYTVLVAPCESLNSTGTNALSGDYQGIERMQFVRVADGTIDPLTGNFVNQSDWITNTYSEVVIDPNSGRVAVQTFQRVLTRPDILFSAADLVNSGADVANTIITVYDRGVNFNQGNIPAGLAGPGTIDPSTIPITFDKVGPVLENETPSTLTEASSSLDGFIWGSFDGSTNVPTVYPNGTSIATLENEALIQISPTTLPDATNRMPYSVTLSVTGGQPPYSWSLATNSPGLPTNLTLNSSSGVISGTPNKSGTFDFVIQMNDSSARSVQINYSITIH